MAVKIQKCSVFQRRATPKELQYDDSSGISESSESSDEEGPVRTQYEYQRAQFAEGYCHVDGCKMAERHADGRKSAFNHNCDGCGRSVHPYCVQEILGMPQGEPDSDKYCTDCFQVKNPPEDEGNDGDGEAKNPHEKEPEEESKEIQGKKALGLSLDIIMSRLYHHGCVRLKQ